MLPVRWRLTLWFSSLLGVALLGLGVLIYVVAGHRLTSEVDDKLQQLANQVHRDLNIPQVEEFDLLSITPNRLVPSSSEFADPGLYVQIMDQQGKVVATSANLRAEQLPTEPTAVWDGLRGKPTVATLVSASGDEVRVRTIPMIHGESVIGLIQVGQSLHHLNQTLRWLGFLLGTSVLAVWSMALLIGWALVGRALKPVSAITATAASIAATGGFADRITYSGPQDEIGRLAATFNRMIDRLESTFESHKKFIADSSHELGTPIAVIRGNAELLNRPLPPTEAREAIRAVQSEAARMERIVSDLLDMAELDMAGVDRHEPVRLDHLAIEVFRATRPVAVGMNLSISQADPVSVAGNADRLREVILNLVDNALKYTPEGGSVALSVQREGIWAQIAVTDTGIGIPLGEQDRIFDRFYRVDKARSRARGGTGLGLAIAKSIVEAHCGRISLTSEPGVGTTFLVRLPLLNS